MECSPASAAAHVNLGNVYNLLKHWDAAIAPLQRAIALNPSHAMAHNNLGSALAGLGRDTEAAACFERALALKPDYAEAASNLASIHFQNGRLVDARRLFAAAVQADPQNPAYYLSLFQCYRIAPGDAHLAALEGLSERADALAAEARVQLHYALAKAYTDLGQNERAFGQLLAGSALKRRGLGYNEAERRHRFARIRSLFTRDFLEARAGSGNNSERPVFIVGMMRSGSTLVEQMLASHPRVHGLGEPPYVNEAYARVANGAGVREPFPESALALAPAHMRAVGDAYLARLGAASASTAARVTDKMLGNFTAIGLIHLALPNARIIHMARDPIDTCLSCFATLFADDQPHTYELGELGRYWSDYNAMMEHWRGVLPAGVMLDVRYEQLVADFTAQARRIVAFCGLEWDDACLSFHKTERPVRTASATQVRQPIYNSSVGRWRPDAATLRPLLEGLGMDEASIARGENAGT